MTANRWDAADYDSTFSFVGRYGDDVLELLDARPGERILDLGCGTGRHAGMLADRGLDVVAVDQDEGMLDRARKEHPSVRFEQLDASAFGSDDIGMFDACFSNAALHWMTDQGQVLRNVRSVLRPGARFVAEMGGAHNIAGMDAALRKGLADIGLTSVSVPSNYFPTVGQQATALEAAGFTVMSMTWFRRPTALEPGSTAADWTRHFRAMVWDQVPPDSVDPLAVAVDHYADDAGLRQGDTWFADYCRLRFVAVAD